MGRRVLAAAALLHDRDLGGLDGQGGDAAGEAGLGPGEGANGRHGHVPRSSALGRARGASMAVGEPEASRRRTCPAGRSAAEDGRGRVCCSARSRRQAAGKKPGPRRCGGPGRPG